MQLVRHETCPQYVARRLSEGWKINRQKGFLVILESPEGILRPVDLRNDIETLRPNASGDECNFSHEYNCSACPDHYTCVDEAVADDGTTYMVHIGSEWARELYNIDDSTGTGTINNITVYAKVACYWTEGHIKLAIKSGTTTDESSEKTFTDIKYHYQSARWSQNPDDNQSWEWADIDALQIGVAMEADDANEVRSSVTQVYVEVDYTPAVAGRSQGHIFG